MSIALYPASNHGVKYILKPKQTSYVLANQMGDAEISCCETQDACKNWISSTQAHVKLSPRTPLQSRARHNRSTAIKLPFRTAEKRSLIKWKSYTAQAILKPASRLNRSEANSGNRSLCPLGWPHFPDVLAKQLFLKGHINVGRKTWFIKWTRASLGLMRPWNVNV